MKRVLLVVIMVFINASLFAAEDDSEMKLIRSRLEQLFSGYDFVEHIPVEMDNDNIKKIIDTMTDDGNWADIDYSSKRMSLWPVMQHCQNLHAFARAYYKEGDSKFGLECKAALLKGLTYWKVVNFRSANWWHNNIYMPEVAGEILILAGDKLPKDLHEFLLNYIMSFAKISMTGQNKVWLSTNVFVRSVITGNLEEAKQASDAISSTIKVEEGEGIQADYSFHQHGSQLQLGNYGNSYVQSISKWIWITSETKYQVSQDRIDLISDFLMECQQWNVWKDKMSICALGRQIWPDSPAGKAKAITKNTVPFLSKAIPAKAKMYDEFLTSVKENRINKNIAEGCRVYWRSDLLVSRGEWMAEIKTDSNHILSGESINGENLLGKFLSAGAYFLHHSGKEYENIFPVLNWWMLPGTTVAIGEGQPKLRGYSKGNEKPFAGGLSNGRSGLIAMDYDFDEVKAKKAYFALPNKIICLGAGISSQSDRPVCTTINQCWANGQAGFVTENEEEIRTKSYYLNSYKLQSLTHDDMEYIPLGQGQNIISQQKIQIGDWYDIRNPQGHIKVQGDVFSIYIDHGTKPTDAKYSYMILNDKCTARKVPEAIVNTPNLQAIYAEGNVYAAFYEAGEFEYAKDKKITVDKPATVIMADGKIYVSQPSRIDSNINVRLDSADKHMSIDLQLPGGMFAGSTVCAEF